MFTTAVCVLFLIKLQWPKNKRLYDSSHYFDAALPGSFCKNYNSPRM